MAKKDIYNYYNVIQNQYLELLNDAKDFEDALNKGLVSEEQYNQAQEMTARYKENYDMWTYVIYLLNMPNRKEKKEKYIKQNKKVGDALSNATMEVTIKEGEDILKEFKKLIKEIK